MKVVEEKYTNTPVFEFSTSARGDIRIIAFVQSEIGTYNTANMGIFNISEKCANDDFFKLLSSLL